MTETRSSRQTLQLYCPKTSKPLNIRLSLLHVVDCRTTFPAAILTSPLSGEFQPQHVSPYETDLSCPS